MVDENPIRTLGDYSKPSHEGYWNTIELPEGNNVVPLRSDTIRLVQNRCSFYGLWSEDPNQHLKGFLKLVDSLDLDVANRERMRLRESLSKAWTRFKDLLQKVPHHGIDLWLQDLALYDNKSWNDPRDFAKSVKAISLPQDVLSTSDRRLIELENQVQRLMEVHLAPNQHVQVNKITSSCEICSGPHDTQYCMENPKQAFVEYASSRTDKAGGKCQSKPEGLVYNFIASQDARLSKFEADFKQQQSEMTNKIDTVLKAITDRIMGALLSDTVKNPKLNVNSTSLVLSTFLANAAMYNVIFDKYVESLELGKNGSAFIQGEMQKRMEDLGLFTLPCRLGDSKPFNTLADLGSCINIIPLYLFKKINIGLLEETDHVFGLADGTKSYPIRIVRDVEVHIGRLKLLNEFYIIDMKKDPKTSLLVGREFLATANAVIDCSEAKIAVGEGITRSVFRVKGIKLGEEEAPYWTTLGKRESYRPRPSSNGVGAQTPYYARKEFMDCHLPGE
ncbi:MAK10-like protein [Tanacetum coccineum]|uniref:MAK10-like protein n=1 Tax=Tanacetum coccineum TaxID=301880 RepID=A0ABQ4YNX3_9ASTR